MKRSAGKFLARDLTVFLSESKKAERLEKFIRRALEAHKFLHLHWFVDYGFEFPRLLISQNLEKFCTLSGVIYPLLVKKFYANMRKEKGCWVTNVDETRIEINLEVLEEIGGLRSTGLAMNDFKDEAWTFFNSDTSFSHCLRPNKAPGRRKSELMKVNDYLLHHVVVQILLPRSYNKAQPNDEDMQCIFALKHGLFINWADVIMRFMIRRFNNPSSALPYPLLISKIIDRAGVNTSNMLKMSVNEKGNKIDRMTLVKKKIVRVNGSWQWIEDAFFNETDLEDEMSEADADPLRSAPPNMKDLLSHVEEHSRMTQLHINERFSKLEERVEHGISLMETFLGTKESTSLSSPNVS